MRAAAVLALALVAASGLAQTATGVVFEDRNGNGRRDPAEPGLAGVRVSNQRQVVRTDARGVWRLPATGEDVFFVVKPRGWASPPSPTGLPAFYYVHKPSGSPALRHAGSPPTGPLPKSIDFPLTGTNEPNRITAAIFGDTQVTDLAQVGFAAQDVASFLGSMPDVSFAAVLGDIVNDQPPMLLPLGRMLATTGKPWHYILGNHDENYDAPDDARSDEHWEHRLGPATYSFDYGPAHFVVLDDVVWHPAVGEKKGYYSAGLTATQLEWLAADLAATPKNQLTVLMMHIPIDEIANRADLYRILQTRPNTLSMSGHTHTTYHLFIGEADGWKGAKPHHHIVAPTACGAWWAGGQDEAGVPHSMMSDGAPNGMILLSIDGNRYRTEFRALRRGPEEQMAISLSEGRVFANVFGGTERSKVEVRFNGGPWRAMARTPGVDPAMAALKARDKASSGASKTDHLWSIDAPTRPGSVLVEVRETDLYGQVHRGLRLVSVP